MRRSSPFLRATLLLLGFLTFSLFAQAQNRASIQGVVTDPSGAVVPGASLTLTDMATGQQQVRESNDVGVYNFNALPANRFRLEIEKKGFKKKVLENLELIPEQPNAVNVTLELGEETLVVNVDASTVPAVDTETASVSGVISSNEVKNLPSFGRDVFQLIRYANGVFGDGAQGNGGGAAQLPGTQGPGATGGDSGIFATENGPQALALGQQYENNGITIDGISTASAVWGGTSIITPTEDSVDNVKVVANSYDAENGRFSGASVQVTSKSGTNNLHGTAFFTAHRPGLNATQPFNGLGNTAIKDTKFFDQFGGSIGGPIWKNKLFAFFAYETVREPKSQPSLANNWYETPEFEASAPSGSIASKYLTFPGSAVNFIKINPSTCALAGLNEGVNCRTIAGKGIDIGSPLTSGLGTQDLTWVSFTNPGVGNGLDGIPDIINYETEGQSTSGKAQYNGRVDADVTAKDRIGAVIYWVPQSSTFLNGPARNYNLFHHDQVNEAYSAIWNHTFSASLLNEARFNAAGWHWNEVASNPQSPVGLPQATFGITNSTTQFGTITNFQQFGPNVGSIFNQWTYSFRDIATKVVKNHTIKAGVDVTRLYYLNECPGCGVPSYLFFNIWDFLNDAPHRERGNFDPNSGSPTTNRQDNRENVLGIFVQDDFKVKRNLTLNLGLRWSYFGPLYSKQNNMFVATPGAGSAYLTGLVVTKRNSWNTQKNNFGPQIGFAWSPSKFNDKFVLRGGYGLNYNQEEIAISGNISSNPGLIVQPTFEMHLPTDPNPGILYATSADPHSLNGFPPNHNAVTTFAPNGLPASGASVNIGIFPHELPTMRVHHYSLDTQYDLGRQFVATIGYQGSISHNLFFHENPLAMPAAAGFPLNPQIGGGDYWSNLGRGNYNALFAGLRHQFSHQFQADAEFTWAKSLDTSSGPYFEQPYPFNTNFDYGRSDYDVSKAFKLIALWQPVFFHGSNRWIEKIAGGWSFSGIFVAHTGFPWTPIVNLPGNLYCGNCGYSQLFPAAYLGGAGTSTSNDQFKTGSNYPKGGAAYFAQTPACSATVTSNCYTIYSGNNSGTANPPFPGVRRNSLNGPGYRDLDATLVKAFGLPNLKGLGENAKLEFRLDAYNVFNNLNFKNTGPGDIVNDVNATGFGRAQQALGGRVVTLGARFEF
jgi:hypothetical protein